MLHLSYWLYYLNDLFEIKLIFLRSMSYVALSAQLPCPDPDAGSQNFVDPIDLGLDPGSQNVADSTDPDPKHCTGAQVLEYLGLYIFIVKISPETVVGLARQDKTLLGKIPTKVFIKLATCDVVR